MPPFVVIVLGLALIALVAALVMRSRAVPNPRARSKQRAKREDAQGRGNSWPAELADPKASDDAPRMPMGDLPPRPSRRRR